MVLFSAKYYVLSHLTIVHLSEDREQNKSIPKNKIRMKMWEETMSRIGITLCVLHSIINEWNNQVKYIQLYFIKDGFDFPLWHLTQLFTYCRKLYTLFVGSFQTELNLCVCVRAIFHSFHFTFLHCLILDTLLDRWLFSQM